MTQEIPNANIYAVGGAVRDILLNKIPKDIDYVVVGTTPQIMLDSSFIQVGSDFPVFLDQNNNEYALARTERKTGDGYHGFETVYDPSITLKDDLYRRDLTINSFAVHVDNWEEFKKTKNTDLIIDPFNGIRDLKNRVLRHISQAFCDDPVRILRIARFKARYHAKYNFKIAPETKALMEIMVKNGEVDHLVPERIWAETEKALMEESPHIFFIELSWCGALEKVLPVLNNTDSYLTDAFKSAAICNLNINNKMMILTSMIHIGRVEIELYKLCIPVNIIKDCLMFNKLRKFLKLNPSMTKSNIFDFLNDINAWKHENRLRNMATAIAMLGHVKYNRSFFMILTSLRFANTANFDMLTSEEKETLKGKEIGEAINELREELIWVSIHA